MLEFNLFEEMKETKDSMQFDSEKTIATLKTDNCYLTLEVRGEVYVCFSEKNMDDNSETCRRPSEFPQALKDLIAGKSPVLSAEGKVEPEGTPWECDYRVYVGNNNWFELFVWTDDTCSEFVTSDVCDAEGLTPEQILDMMLEFEKEVLKDKEVAE